MFRRKVFEIGKYDLIFSFFVGDRIHLLGILVSYYPTTFSFEIGMWLFDFGIMLWRRNDR
jgi:hypothetical protein